MNEFMLKKRKLLMDDSWDVIVDGGGPAGCAVAIAAAREGAKTLLIEATGSLGGMVSEVGVVILFYTMLADVETEKDGKVSAYS